MGKPRAVFFWVLTAGWLLSPVILGLAVWADFRSLTAVALAIGSFTVGWFACQWMRVTAPRGIEDAWREFDFAAREDAGRRSGPAGDLRQRQGQRTNDARRRKLRGPPRPRR